MNARVIVGEALEVLRDLAADSVDALVTDPPAGIGFMGKEWDGSNRRSHFLAAIGPIFRECLRVLKPGAHGLVWALPRTSHWTATALEDAGFEVRDVITHHFGQGFPKSLDVAKAIDKAAGHWRGRAGEPRSGNGAMAGPNYQRTEKGDAVTAAAAAWEGWGTALKPATEHWILVRRPLSQTTVAGNVLRHGTGALNVDGARVGVGPSPSVDRRKLTADGRVPGGQGSPSGWHKSDNGEAFTAARPGEELGRWPANLVLSHAPECVELSCVTWCPVWQLDRQSGECGGAAPASGPTRTRTSTSTSTSRGLFRGTDEEPAFYDDFGGASRFFYVAKPDRGERDIGLEGIEAPYDHSGPRGHDLNGDGTPRPRPRPRGNHHPTVKSVELMRWLVRLVTPPKGLVLDPFTGSGSTGVAALRGAFRFLGIERDPEYAEIARRRILGDTPLFARVDLEVHE